MSHPVGAPLHERMAVEFVEADVDIGFHLVDLAECEGKMGNLPVACRVLADAEAVYQEIESRLERSGTHERECFGPLVAELRREIDCAKIRYHRS